MRPGQRFERLTAIRPSGRTRSGALQWKFSCDCGAIVDKHAWSVRNGKTRSCGCLQRERTAAAARATLPPIEKGQRFARLTALRPLAVLRGRSRWAFMCDCGAETHTVASDVLSGHTTSCGCRLFIRSTIEHGESHYNRTAEYTAWKNMKARCHNPRNDKFSYYGGRGIEVCPEWRDDFDAFLAHIGRRPGKGYSVDRIDNSRGYEPGNVRWATAYQQRHNRRPLSKRAS